MDKKDHNSKSNDHSKELSSRRLLEEIWRNYTREQEVLKELEKDKE